MKKLYVICFLILLVISYSACTTSQKSTSTEAESTPALCDLPPIIVPTPPAVIPHYTKLDETTNLHVTGVMKEIDPVDYRLVVTGTVAHPLSLTYDELRCMPKREVRALLVCPGFFEDEATWAGVPLDYILEMAEVAPDATEMTMRGADGYTTRLALDIVDDGNRHILAYEWEGEPLPALHGFPVRGVFPGQQGNKWVKWLLEIEIH